MAIKTSEEALEMISEATTFLQGVEPSLSLVDMGALLNARWKRLNEINDSWKDFFKENSDWNVPVVGTNFEGVKTSQQKTYTNTKQIQADMGDEFKKYQSLRSETHFTFRPRT